MAKIKTDGLAEQVATLEKVSDKAHGIIKMAVYDGADVIADAIRAEMNAKIKPYSGGLAKSLYTSKIKDKDGTIYTEIGFAGYSEVTEGKKTRRVPNPLKAAVLEYGSSHVPKRPFIRPAVNKVKNQAVMKMKERIDYWISQLTK